MYRGSNPTAIRSMKWLSEAMMDLLKEKQYSKINVKDICTRADLSRQTFYQIFNSKEEIIRHCIKQSFESLEELPKRTDFKSSTAFIAKNISKNKEFIRLLSENHLGYMLSEEISLALTTLAERLDPYRSPEKRRLANAFFSAALANSFLEWSASDSVSENDFVTLMHSILSGEYYRIK